MQLRVPAIDQLEATAERSLGDEAERRAQLLGDEEGVARLLSALRQRVAAGEEECLAVAGAQRSEDLCQVRRLAVAKQREARGQLRPRPRRDACAHRRRPRGVEYLRHVVVVRAVDGAAMAA